MVGAVPERSKTIWGIAWIVSLLVHLVLVLGLVGVDGWRREKRQAVEEVAKEEVVEVSPEMIVVEVVPSVVEAADEPEVKKSFVRTSEDQEVERDGPAAYIAERSTRAASEGEAVKDGPALPSQEGVEVKERERMELTESRYEDGELEVEPGGMPAKEAMAEESIEGQGGKKVEGAEEGSPEALARVENPMEGGVDETSRAGSEHGELLPEVKDGGMRKDRLAQGTETVEVEVPDLKAEEESKPPTPREEADTAKQEEQKMKPRTADSSEMAGAGGFSGFQEKTKVSGTISRQGIRASLEAEKTLLGKYQAQVSRAIEREWQLNITRHAQYITPGMVTVRFVISSEGKVTHTGIVDQFGAGMIQKSFTLSSIKDAKLPAIPEELRKELKGGPLEFTYNFHFN